MVPTHIIAFKMGRNVRDSWYLKCYCVIIMFLSGVLVGCMTTKEASIGHPNDLFYK